jgi:hypothetical protein
MQGVFATIGTPVPSAQANPSKLKSLREDVNNLIVNYNTQGKHKYKENDGTDVKKVNPFAIAESPMVGGSKITINRVIEDAYATPEKGYSKVTNSMFKL